MIIRQCFTDIIAAAGENAGGDKYTVRLEEWTDHTGKRDDHIGKDI